MTPVALEGFLSKKQIEASYGRSYRSLTRDITRAVRTANTDILRHLKLVTEDEQVREGTEVTLELIQDLSNHGLRPTWLAEQLWVAEWCARQRLGSPRQPAEDNPSDEPGPSPATAASTPDSAAPLPPTSAAAVEMLQQRIGDQKQQIDLLRGQLQIKDEQIRTANQLAEQSQQLMRDLHVLLKNVQDGLLGEGSGRLIPARTAATRSPQGQPAESARPLAGYRPEPTPRASRPDQTGGPTVTGLPKAAPAATTATRTGRQPATGARRPAPKRPARRARQSKPVAAPAPQPPAGVVSKYLPTLDRAVRSLFRK